MTEQILDLFAKSAQPQDNSNLFQIGILAVATVLFASVFLLVNTSF